MEIPAYTIKLEAVSSVESILNAYDGTSESWNVPLIGSFWEVVHHAHELRRRGQGNRVAIIDSGCDLSVPRLKRQVGTYYNLAKRPATGRHNDHGTAVALLISEVAPDCILDIYNVAAEDGTIQEPDVVEAISRAARSDATIINLSLGNERGWIPHGDIASFENWDDYLAHKRDTFSETEPCSLCAAALSATDAGKMVFAAVGNELRYAYCPARADRVVAVGFQSQRTLKQELGFETRQQVPVFHQAIGADLMLLEVPGALGSSFASPLYAGVAALGLTQEELFKYVASYAARVFPLMKHAMVDTELGGVSKAPQQLLDQIDRGYWKSVSLLPHAHCKVQAQRLPQVRLMDPAACPFCGIFADLQLVNLGYWLYSQRHPLEALDALKAARTLCPWSDKAVAFEGSALSMIGRHDEAIKNYEVAVQMRPGYPPYQSTLEALRTIARVGGSELPSGVENTPLDFVRARRRELVQMNLIHYVLAAVLLSVHLAYPASTWAKWLLLVPVIIGLGRARQCFFNARVCDRYFHLQPDHLTRYSLKMLARLLRISSVAFAASASGLLTAMFFL